MSLDYFGQSMYREDWNGLELVYSCDKIVVTGKFAFGRDTEMLCYLDKLYHYGPVVRELPWGFELQNVKFYERVSLMCYRNNFVLEFYDENKDKLSFYFAIGYNDNSGYCNKWKLEFNPNKILTNCGVWMREFLCKLKGCTVVDGYRNSLEVKEIDLAIDFPVARDCVLYDKGSRLHKMYMLSLLNRTDYYGEAQKHGCTKIYNKGLEAGIDRDLTRLEVTLQLWDYHSVRQYFEGLRVLRHGQMAIGELGNGLNQTDKVLLELLNMHPEYYSRLGRDKKAKLKPYLEDFVQPFTLGLKAFNHVCGWVGWWRTMSIGGICGVDG